MRNPVTSSIGRKIFLGFFIIVFICFIAATSAFYQLETIRINEEDMPLQISQLSYLQEFSITLESLEKNVDRLNIMGYEQYKDSAKSDAEKMTAAIVGIKNNMEAKLLPKAMEMERLTSELGANVAFLASAEQSQASTQETNERIILVYQQINAAKRLNSEMLSAHTLNIQENIAEQKEIIFSVISEFAAMMVSILVAGLLISLIISRSISKPARMLRDAVIEIDKGNLDTRIDIKSKDEIGELASAFKQMASDLKNSQEQIKKHSEELERTVSERTAQLDAKLKELEDNRTAILNMMEDVDSTNKDLVGTQSKLKKSFTELKRLDQEKDSFISIAAHELKTPMTVIHGFAQLLENEKTIKDSETRNKYLKIIEHEVERLAKMVTEVLDLSRADLGTIKFTIENVDVAKIAEEVEVELTEKAKSKKLFLEFKKEKGLPIIQIDKEKLKQILINLIDNSIKYSEKGGTTVEAVKDGDFLKFSVSDKGIGIPKKRYEKMFTRFYQVENPLTRKVGGTGLGLSICKEFVEALGGKIWFESHVGKGTKFFFTVPIKSRVAEANKYQKQNNNKEMHK